MLNNGWVCGLLHCAPCDPRYDFFVKTVGGSNRVRLFMGAKLVLKGEFAFNACRHVFIPDFVVCSACQRGFALRVVKWVCGLFADPCAELCVQVIGCCD